MSGSSKSTGKKIADELIKPGYSGRARKRAMRRKSSWNLFLLVVVFSCIAVSAMMIVQIADLYIQFQGNEPLFSNDNPEWMRIVVVCGALIVSFPVGMIAGNFLVWLVPPARRALDCEVEAHPGTDYQTAQHQLMHMAKKIAALYKKLLGWIS